MGHVTHTGQMNGASKVLVVKCEWERPLGRARHRWEGIIKMYLGKMVLDCIHLAQGSGHKETITNLQVRKKSNIS